MPLAASTCLAIALSIASAEPSTPAPTYGHVGQLEQALHRAVLAHRTVQQRQDDGALAGLVELAQHGLGRHRAADRCRGGRQRRRPRAASASRAPSASCPLAVAARCRRRDPVARGIDGAQHVGGRHAADVVLGRLAAEQHDEVDPVRLPSARNGTVRRGEDPGIRRGRCHRWHARGPDVDLDGASFDSRIAAPGPAVRARSSPSATATTSSPPRWPRGAAGDLASRPRRHGDHDHRGRRHRRPR